jgi:NAD-dependent DNA ligase
LVNLGATSKSGVSKKTNVLLVGTAPGGTKTRDAIKHGVKQVGADWLKATFTKHGVDVPEFKVFDVEDVVD